MLPSEPWEEYGIEDPRIVKLDGRYYMTYVAVSRHGVATALASTTDFVTFERHGIIFCPQNKDVVLFPEKIRGAFHALHRPQDTFTRPEIWHARSNDILHWGEHARVYGGVCGWESGRIGAGPPPIRVPQGWLAIYHGCEATSTERTGVYVTGVLLLDTDNPAILRARSSKPILRPQESWERSGFVNEVVFPTGISLQGDTLLVYYGAADTCIGVAELSCSQILNTVQEI